jgi:acylphosphatase
VGHHGTVIRRRVVVTGLVQGVWFRESCRREAERLGVHGWVHNRADGSVEGAFEGDTEAIDRLVEWCRVGPPQAIVADVEVHDEPATGEHGFDVR